ncbi:calpain-1 catalytic subunit [Xyrauchen texanus]|uniref:calpain-1 catalytic subunit n=1 Tax=Xyrauchen texanus TaxID=154827 RepID=UPI002241E514|nr:calpain-1 catalytic subunit [Xyrauchen texanus]
MPASGVCLNIVSARNHKDGQGSPSNPEMFLGQDFHRLKTFCLRERLRFIDNLFPPEKKSIGLGPLPYADLARVVWKRPQDLVSNPVYIVEGTSRFDFIQGNIGNCWFLASVGALTFQRRIMTQIIQEEQNFSVDYAGIFHFRFWRFGKWVDVVIDDKLPTIDGRLIFVQSKTANEFWPALLEKAYAKVCGSYADMNAGNISEALLDFTGGPHMTFKLSEATKNLWELMRRASQSESLMGCGTPGGPVLQNTVLRSGLVEMHAYAVTGVAEVVCQGRPVKLVRILNPWGRGEWSGDWSDKSPLWKLARPEDQRYNTVLDNGEFWMSMEDFCKNYENLDVCCTDINVLAGSQSSSWKSEVHNGQWVIGTTAGGCLNNPDSFSKNPQYRVILEKTAEDPREENTPNLLVSLTQKSNKRNRHLATNLHIGFVIYEVPTHLKDHQGKLSGSFFKSTPPVGKVKNYLNAREIMEFFRLKAGEYIIVPSTFDRNEASSFILNIYSKTKAIVQDSSGYGITRTKIIPRDNDDSFPLFLQYADEFGEVDAERLQRLLNENIHAGLSQKPKGFSLDLCKSLVALMDLTVTGRLCEFECLRLWKRVEMLKDIFYRNDITHTGTLSLNELQNALQAAGFALSDSMLNLMALRYGDSRGQITLENFVFLIIRMECMAKTFKRIAAGGQGMMLQENEWMQLTLYS